MSKGSSQLFFDECFFLDLDPLFLSLKYVCGQGACSGGNIVYDSPDIHGGKKPTLLCSTHSEASADQSQSLHRNGQGGTPGQVPSEWWGSRLPCGVRTRKDPKSTCRGSGGPGIGCAPSPGLRHPEPGQSRAPSSVMADKVATNLPDISPPHETTSES